MVICHLPVAVLSMNKNILGTSLAALSSHLLARASQFIGRGTENCSEYSTQVIA